MIMWFGYACMWLATSAAVIYGIETTGNGQCLWAMLIPTIVSFKTSRTKVD